MWLVKKYHAWKTSRENYVIAQALLLGADIHPFVSNTDAMYAKREGRMPYVMYRAHAPVHGGMGEVTVYGKTVFACAKAWMRLQEVV